MPQELYSLHHLNMVEFSTNKRKPKKLPAENDRQVFLTWEGGRHSNRKVWLELKLSLSTSLSKATILFIHCLPQLKEGKTNLMNDTLEFILSEITTMAHSPHI